LSEKIASLEAALGVRLLRRGERGRAQLTAPGVDLIRSTATALDGLRSLEDREARGSLRVLRLGTYESIGMRVLPRVITSLRRDLPHTRLQLATRRSATLVRLVASGDLDVAVAVGPVHDTRVEVVVVGRQELRLYRPVFVAEAAAWDAARQNDWCGLMFGKGSAPTFYQRFCRKLGLGPLPRIVSESFETLRATAIETGLPVVLPPMVGEHGSPASPDLVRMNLGSEHAVDGSHDIHLVTLRTLSGSERTPERAAFYLVRNAMREALAQ
jgi:DNA-binding transcriptional LysR family regulator